MKIECGGYVGEAKTVIHQMVFDENGDPRANMIEHYIVVDVDGRSPYEGSSALMPLKVDRARGDLVGRSVKVTIEIPSEQKVGGE